MGVVCRTGRLSHGEESGFRGASVTCFGWRLRGLAKHQPARPLIGCPWIRAQDFGT